MDRLANRQKIAMKALGEFVKKVEGPLMVLAASVYLISLFYQNVVSVLIIHSVYL